MHDSIGFAVEHDLTPVCNPMEWDTFKHGTGNLGFLFGCSETLVQGELMSCAELHELDLPVQNICVTVTHGNLTARDSDCHGEILEVKGDTIYVAENKARSKNVRSSQEWFKKQYHFVREHDETRNKTSCWADDNRHRIAFAVRRGDVTHQLSGPGPMNHAFPSSMFVNGLKKLLKEKQAYAKNAQVVVVAQVPEDDEEIKGFEALRKHGVTVSYQLGKEILDDEKASQTALVRDMDCLVTSDVMFLSKGSFSGLVASMQKQGGIAVQLDEDDGRNDDLPNVITLRGINS